MPEVCLWRRLRPLRLPLHRFRLYIRLLVSVRRGVQDETVGVGTSSRTTPVAALTVGPRTRATATEAGARKKVAMVGAQVAQVVLVRAAAAAARQGTELAVAGI